MANSPDKKSTKGFTVPLPLKVPVSLSNLELRDKILLAKDYITMNGGLMRTAAAPNSSDTAAHVPFLLFPSLFPRKLFDLVMSVQEDFHRLLHHMALDREFLYSSLKYIIETDPFTRRLWELYEEVYNNKEKQPRLYMGTSRNDYMVHQPRDSNALRALQVEYNMIAVSFGPLETIIGRWHKMLLERLLGQDTSPLQIDGKGTPNEPGVGLARTVVTAAKTYKEMFSCASPDTYVLIVADSPARNIFDQRWVELAMLEADSRVKTLRRTFAQLRTAIDFHEVKKSGRLIVEGHEMAAVYFRTGYNETDYDYDAGDWEVRRAIELSHAPKAPCVAHQLANYKKIQQVIARPGQLERLGMAGDAAARMRQTFAELLGLEFDEAGEKAVERGLAHPEDFVLKPMQEGGGHNYFGAALGDKLRQLRDKPERQNFILMQLIRPPLNENISVAPGEPVEDPRPGRFSSEIGIYGSFIVVDGQMTQNKALGYLLRSKPEGVNESGVAAGFGRIDSAYFSQ